MATENGQNPKDLYAANLKVFTLLRPVINEREFHQRHPMGTMPYCEELAHLSCPLIV